MEGDRTPISPAHSSATTTLTGGDALVQGQDGRDPKGKISVWSWIYRLVC